MRYSGVFLDQRFRFYYIFYSNGFYQATATVVLFKRLSLKLKFSVPFGHNGFYSRLFPKTCGKIRKAFLVRLASEKVI